MSDKDYIEQLFSEKLSNLEVPVNPALWNGIAASIAGTSTAVVVAKTGMSLLSKVAISIVSVGIVGGSIAYFSASEDQKNEKKDAQHTSIDVKKEVKPEFANPVDETHATLPVAESTLVSSQIILPKTQVDKSSYNHEDHDAVSFPPVVPVEMNLGANLPDKVIESTPIVKQEEKVVVTVRNVETPTKHQDIVDNKVLGTVDSWQKTNVFSPNNDGVNDLFYLKTSNLKEFTISILNDKNQIVFQTQDPNFKWDGTDFKTGEIVSSGNYSYIIFAIDTNNQTIKQFNMLTISK